MKTLSRCIILFVLLAGVALAESEGELHRARAHFEAGRALYSLGNYDDALREFVAGYDLVPKPQFLLNLGQTYRKLGKAVKAKEMYERFLVQAPPDDPSRGIVNQIIGELDQALRQEAASAAKVASALTPRVTGPQAAPTEALRVQRETEPPPKSTFRRVWWIIPLTAAVVAGAAVGIYFVARPGVDCSSVAFGCIDAR